MTDRDHLLIMEAAMCMWEEALSLFQNDEQWKNYVEDVGYGNVRLEIRNMAPMLEADWKTVQDNYAYCFDWDFVPAWMKANILINDDEGMHVRPDREIPTRE